jgi:hypothetical protein
MTLVGSRVSPEPRIVSQLRLFTEELDLAKRIGMHLNIACALIDLAMAGNATDDPGWSARLHGAADQILDEHGHILEPLESRLTDMHRQHLRDAIGAEAFEDEYAAGRVLTRRRRMGFLRGTAAG